MKMSGDGKTVELFYDVVSPYSYLAFELLTRYNKRWQNMELKLRPAYLRDVMIKTGNQSPGTVPAKKMYMGVDLMRLSAFYKIPFAIPKDVDLVMGVKGSQKAQRLLAVIAEQCPQYLESVTHEIYQRIWHRDEDICDDDSLTAACNAATVPPERIRELIQCANEEPSLDSLHVNTEDALAKGVFGMPAIILHSDDKNHLFFGADRIFLLGHFLGEQVQPNSFISA